jgi:hypothetical protein
MDFYSSYGVNDITIDWLMYNVDLNNIPDISWREHIL